jgi:hypothetical protein
LKIFLEAAERDSGRFLYDPGLIDFAGLRLYFPVNV